MLFIVDLSFRALHQQLDDDNDGTIEPSETGDFIREDLQYRGSQDKHQQQIRQKRFHGQVKEDSFEKGRGFESN